MSYPPLPKFNMPFDIKVTRIPTHADLCLAIPEGTPCLAWFATSTHCYLLTIGADKSIVGSKLLSISFDPSLCGTLLIGTSFPPYFAMEDMLFCQGRPSFHLTYPEKLAVWKYWLATHKLLQQLLSPEGTAFGLPLMHERMDALLEEMATLPYKIACVQFRFFSSKHKVMSMAAEWCGRTSKKRSIDEMSSSSSSFTPSSNTPSFSTHVNTHAPPLSSMLPSYTPCATTKEWFQKSKQLNEKRFPTKTFRVVPTIEFEIYHLYEENDNTLVGVAGITSLATSMKMNALFRNIKENKSLDAIEESDDEDDFENERKDKFVFLDKSISMECVYHPKFKRWCPICA